EDAVATSPGGEMSTLRSREGRVPRLSTAFRALSRLGCAARVAMPPWGAGWPRPPRVARFGIPRSAWAVEVGVLPSRPTAWSFVSVAIAVPPERVRREDYRARCGRGVPARGVVLEGMAAPWRLRLLVLLWRLRCGDPGGDPLWHRRLLAEAQLPRQEVLASGLAPSSGSRASCLPRASSRRRGRVPPGQPSSSEGLNQAGPNF